MVPTAAPPSAAEIATLMQLFYLKVERDKALGPTFAPVLRDWPGYLDGMTRFWTAALLGGRSDCDGRSVVMLAPHPIAPLQFVRWLALFRAAAGELFGPERARAFLDRAERIAPGLQMGLFMAPRMPANRAVAHGQVA